MTVAALQALAILAAGFALFRLWRAALPAELWLRRVVAAGFLVRAVGGQLLFWISWAQLPLLPRLQSGNGLWFFALDAVSYFARAAAASSDGLTAIARLSSAEPAVVYVQLLAVATWLFGAVTSTALLVNLFCYLGCVALLRRWTSSAIAITAISFSPSFVLWSLQPLKESLFQLLVVAFVCACAAWQRAWTHPPRWRNVAALGATLALVLAALSGVRWYVAVVVLAVTLPFLLAVALRARARKGIALAAAAAVALLLSRALLAGGGTQVPPPIVELLTPSTSFATMAQLPSLVGSQLGGARDALEAQGGGTVIQPPPRPLVTPLATTLPVAPAPTNPPHARVATGAAAMLLPRVIGQALGLFHIPGGRGFLWLTDVDTLAFDLALCLAVAAIATRFRAARRDPLVWMLAALTLLIGGALAYSVTNFGTLFRLRQTVYLGVILLPAALRLLDDSMTRRLAD
jgi:hypothetical protein